MKRGISPIVLVAIVTLITTFCQQQGRKRYAHRYPFASAVVVYKQQGHAFGVATTITKKVSIAEHGKRIAIESQQSRCYQALGINSCDSLHTLELQCADTLYSVNLTTHTAHMALSPTRGGQTEWLSIHPIYSNRWTKAAEVKHTGSDTLLGRVCQVYQGRTTTVWVYKALALRTESIELGQKVVETAIAINEGACIPRQTFTVPQGIAITQSIATISTTEFTH